MLETSRLAIRSFTSSDIDKVYEGLSHPDVIKYYGVSYSSLEHTKIQMKWFQDLESAKLGKWFAITDRESKIFMGAIGLSAWDHDHDKAELGFWLLPEFWKKGIVSEALEAIVQYAKEVMKLHRIEAEVETENDASLRTLLKSGFELEGIKRESEFKNGRYISMYFVAKIID